MVKRPGRPARGSATGRPLMVLLDVLGQRWTLRVLWELRNGRVTFRALRTLCDEVSPTLLNTRLKTLRDLALVDLEDDGYGLTAQGADLARQFARLDRWAEDWAKDVLR